MKKKIYVKMNEFLDTESNRKSYDRTDDYS